MQVVWSAPEDHGEPIDKYELAVGGAPPVELGGTRLQYIVTPLLPASTRNFTLRAHNAIGWGNYSKLAELITESTVPSAPGAPVYKIDYETKSVVLNWTAALPHGYAIHDYEIEGLDSYLPRTSLGASGLSFVFHYTDETRDYHFRVRARSAHPDEYGPWSPYTVSSQARSHRARCDPTRPRS